MDQFNLWQVVSRQVFTPYFCILVSTAFVVVSDLSDLSEKFKLSTLEVQI